MNYFVVLAAVLMALTGTVKATVTNGGFEDGITGWELSGFDPELRTEFLANFSQAQPEVTIYPTQGAQFVLLQSGGGNLQTSYCEITQVVTFNDGDIFSGNFFFATKDYLQWNDRAFIKLVPTRDSTLKDITLAESSVEVVGNFGSMTEWGSFTRSFNSSNAGTYKLICRVQDELDNILTSYWALDNFEVTSTPEPATISLLVLGAAGLRRLRR